MNKFETYLSPYTWRYGSAEMRHIWSEFHKRRLWRKIWVALAEVQAGYGLVSDDQLAALRAHAGAIDVERALEIESQIHHDLMAEVEVYAGQCGKAGGVIHLGATSMDIKDNATALQIRESLDLILRGCQELMRLLSKKILSTLDVPVIAFTHLQPAEPTTLGYRLAQYTRDLLSDWENLNHARASSRGKGFKGAVGTSASYAELLGPENLQDFEGRLSEKLALPFFKITTQTYPRKQDYQVLSALAGLGATLYKFAFDLRVLQSAPIGEMSEPFGEKQVGSSAMPFKRNPIKAEKIDSLARLLAQYPRLAWDNAAHSLLERTLDDSANRRTMLPEAFLMAEEIVQTAKSIVANLEIEKDRLRQNLSVYAPFAATERVLMGLTKAGADRQEMHAHLRDYALRAWDALQRGEENPLVHLITNAPEFTEYLPASQLKALMEVSEYLGDAPRRARELAESVLAKIAPGD